MYMYKNLCTTVCPKSLSSRASLLSPVSSRIPHRFRSPSELLISSRTCSNRPSQACALISSQERNHMQHIDQGLSVPSLVTMMTTKNCLVCGTPTTKSCLGCKSASYCSDAHQKQVGEDSLFKNHPPISFAGLAIA